MMMLMGAIGTAYRKHLDESGEDLYDDNEQDD